MKDIDAYWDDALKRGLFGDPEQDEIAKDIIAGIQT